VNNTVVFYTPLPESERENVEWPQNSCKNYVGRKRKVKMESGGGGEPWKSLRR